MSTSGPENENRVRVYAFNKIAEELLLRTDKEPEPYLATKGLMRISGKQTEIDAAYQQITSPPSTEGRSMDRDLSEVLSQFDRENEESTSSAETVHNMMGLFKRAATELLDNSTVIREALDAEFIPHLSDDPPPENILENVLQHLRQKEAYDEVRAIQALMYICHQISINNEQNKMTAQNLAMVLAPSFLGSSSPDAFSNIPLAINLLQQSIINSSDSKPVFPPSDEVTVPQRLTQLANRQRPVASASITEEPTASRWADLASRGRAAVSNAWQKMFGRNIEVSAPLSTEQAEIASAKSSAKSSESTFQTKGARAWMDKAINAANTFLKGAVKVLGTVATTLFNAGKKLWDSGKQAWVQRTKGGQPQEINRPKSFIDRTRESMTQPSSFADKLYNLADTTHSALVTSATSAGEGMAMIKAVENLRRYTRENPDATRKSAFSNSQDHYTNISILNLLENMTIAAEKPDGSPEQLEALRQINETVSQLRESQLAREKEKRKETEHVHSIVKSMNEPSLPLSNHDPFAKRLWAVTDFAENYVFSHNNQSGRLDMITILQDLRADFKSKPNIDNEQAIELVDKKIGKITDPTEKAAVEKLFESLITAAEQEPETKGQEDAAYAVLQNVENYKANIQRKVPSTSEQVAKTQHPEVQKTLKEVDSVVERIKSRQSSDGARVRPISITGNGDYPPPVAKGNKEKEKDVVDKNKEESVAKKGPGKG